MAKREMPTNQMIISNQEWDNIRASSAEVADNVEKLLDKPVQISQSEIGTVINCKKLNLRVKPSKAASIIYEMPADSRLTIDINKSVNGWLYVRTESGLEGFCMKEFVSIK